jgi:transposase-like protein
MPMYLSAFPEPDRRQIRSANPLELQEIKRRTGVVGISPPAARSSGSSALILAERDDDWQDGRRYSRPETMAPHRRVSARGGGSDLLMMAS